MSKTDEGSHAGTKRWTEWAYDGLGHFHDTTYLGCMVWGQVDGPFVRDCLPSVQESDAAQRGLAVQAALRFGLEKMRVSGELPLRQSYETLWLRFVEQKTVTECAEILKRDGTTIKRRQRKGWERLGAILREEWMEPIGGNVRRTWMLQAMYEGCSAEEQRLLSFLSVFEKPVGLRVAMMVSEIVFQPFLARLQMRGIVTRKDQTFAVDMELREVALREGDAADILHFHTLAADYRSQEGDTASAISHWLHAEAHETAAQYLLSHIEQSEVMVEELLGRFEQRRVSADTWAQLKLLAGQRAEQSKNLDIAFAEYSAALCAEDLLLAAEAYFRMGKLYRHRDVDAALTEFALSRHALTDRHDAPAIFLRVMTMLHEAWIFIDQRPDPSATTTLLDEAEVIVATYTKADKVILQCDLANARASHFTQVGDVTSGLPFRHAARRHARQAQDVERMVTCTYNLAWDMSDLAQYDEAEQMFLECQMLAEALNDAMKIAACDKGLGACYVLGNQNYRQAIEHLLKAYHYFRQADNLFWTALTCYDLAEAHILDSAVMEAMAYFAEGQQIGKDAKIAHVQQLFANLQREYVEFSAELTDAQRQLYNTIRTHGRMNRRTCATLLGVSERTAARRLDKMVAQGLIARRGQSRGTYYVLTAA